MKYTQQLLPNSGKFFCVLTKCTVIDDSVIFLEQKSRVHSNYARWSQCLRKSSVVYNSLHTWSLLFSTVIARFRTRWTSYLDCELVFGIILDTIDWESMFGLCVQEIRVSEGNMGELLC